MQVVTFDDAVAFLKCTQSTLEANEVANSLVLGICLRLKQHPERAEYPPCLRAVKGQRGLLLSAVMTPPHALIVVGHCLDVNPAARVLAKHLWHAAKNVPGVFGPKASAFAFAQQWAAVTRQRYRLDSAQRAWALHKVATPPPKSGHLRQAIAEEMEVLVSWWQGFHLDVWGKAGAQDAVREVIQQHVRDGSLYVWDCAGQPVSMAVTTRPTRYSISVSMVYTPPALRGKGYATACVRELSRLLLASGWACCSLFTDLANPISNHIYEKIGYRPVCDYDKYVFGEPKQ